STDTAEAEGEPEEDAGDHADASGHQLLREDDYGREGGRQDEPDQDDEDVGPRQVGIRQRQRERQAAEDREPDHRLGAEAIAEQAAEDEAGGGRAEEQEQHQ